MPSLLTYALTSLADVKESLGIAAGDISKDNLIKRKINQATEMIEGFCQLAADHHFVSATYTQEEYDGGGSNQLSLRMRPVTALTNFQYRYSSLNMSNWNDVDTDYYFLDQPSGIIDLLFNQSLDWNRYRVTYTAGYTTIPSDLSEACVALSGYLVENSATGTAVKKKQEGARSIEYFDSGQGSGDSLVESLGLDNMLARYVNYALLLDK